MSLTYALYLNFYRILSLGMGIGKWTEAEFVSTLKTLRRANGTMMRYPMMPYGMLTDGELKAIYAYLRTVPPIQN